MNDMPEFFKNEAELEEYLSRPTQEVIDLMRDTEGDLLFLGIAGKIGPSLARMAKRACSAAGVKKRVVGVSRFSNPHERADLEANGIETIQGDLLDPDFVKTLPAVPNVFFLAGMKFGAQDKLAYTWAMNTYVPALVAEHFRNSRIVAFSTGCVYPLVPVESDGSTEQDMPVAIGEYAQSCLGRERLFEYGSLRHKTAVTLVRLNYAVEMRYGVVVDIACKVYNRQPVDLTMGYFNVIWQGDMNAAVLRCLPLCSTPAQIINLTGPETLSVKETALALGALMDKEPIFTGEEAPTALLNNANLAHQHFGLPQVKPEIMFRWIAEWIKDDKRLLNKPTHFEERDGKY